MPSKIVHLITLLELGGAQGNTIHTVRHLDRDRFEAHLWSGAGAYWDKDVANDPRLRDRIRFFRHLVRPIHPLNDLRAIFDLRRAFRELGPAALHTHSSKAGILGRIAARLAGVPVIIHTYHGFGFHERQPFPIRWLYVFLERLTARWTDRLIFVSHANMNTAARYKIGRREQYALIRSGVPLSGLKAAFGDAGETLKFLPGLPASDSTVLTVGPFKAQKNLGDFLEVAALVLKSKPKALFLVVGDGELRPALERRIAQLGISDRVRLLGWREDVASIMAVSKLFVMTSLWEGLPRSLVEALALGVPAVCYDTDGVRDVLEAGGGYLIAQKNVPEAARRIVELLSDEKLRAALSEVARRTIGVEFDIDHMVRQQEVLYSELIPDR